MPDYQLVHSYEHFTVSGHCAILYDCCPLTVKEERVKLSESKQHLFLDTQTCKHIRLKVILKSTECNITEN
jgi:hypothetical protein